MAAHMAKGSVMAKKVTRYVSDDGVTEFETLGSCVNFDKTVKIASLLDKANRNNPADWICGFEHDDWLRAAIVLLVPGVVDDIQKILKKF